jgi:hypothetical protein
MLPVDGVKKPDEGWVDDGGVSGSGGGKGCD